MKRRRRRAWTARRASAAASGCARSGRMIAPAMSALQFAEFLAGSALRRRAALAFESDG